MSEGSKTADSADVVQVPQITLLIENPRKTNNWGPMLRCCAAYGISQVFVVGTEKCNLQGSHGAAKHVELVPFPTHQLAVETLTENNFKLFGVLHGIPDSYDPNGYHVEKIIITDPTLSRGDTAHVDISKKSTSTTATGNMHPSVRLNSKSYPVHCQPFHQRTCLVVSKQGQGMPWSLAEHCSQFIHIPLQSGLDDSSWLTTEASVSIILHEFATWAEYDKRSSNSTSYQGQKYHVKKISRGQGENSTKKTEERKRRHDELEQEQETIPDDGDDVNAAPMIDIFDTGDCDGDY